MSELSRGSERWIDDAGGRRWRVELAPPEPILGTGLGIAPAVQHPEARARRLRFTPDGDSGGVLWSREEFPPGVELASLPDSALLDQLRGAR